MKVKIIRNVGSGSADSGGDKLKALFGENGATDVEIHSVRGRRIRHALQRAREAKPDIIVVAGGDGSVSTAAGELAGSKIPLGVLPMGTFNNFARDAKIPLDIEEAVKVVVSGKPQRIDLGQVNDRVFINNSSIGLYPRIVQQREEISDTVGGRKWLSMPIACLSIFRRFPVFRAHLEIGNKDVTLKSPFVFIGNNEYETNPLKLGRRKSLTSGKLSLYTTSNTERVYIMRLIFKAILGSPNEDVDFEFHKAREIRLDNGKRTIRVALDGEVYRMKTPLCYKSLPKKLSVILPGVKDTKQKKTERHETQKDSAYI